MFWIVSCIFKHTHIVVFISYYSVEEFFLPYCCSRGIGFNWERGVSPPISNVIENSLGRIFLPSMLGAKNTSLQMMSGAGRPLSQLLLTISLLLVSIGCIRWGNNVLDCFLYIQAHAYSGLHFLLFCRRILFAILNQLSAVACLFRVKRNF